MIRLHWQPAMLATACRRTQALRVAVKSAARAAVPVATTRIATPAAAPQLRPSLPLVGVPLGSVPWMASADAALGASLGVEFRLTCCCLARVLAVQWRLATIPYLCGRRHAFHVFSSAPRGTRCAAGLEHFLFYLCLPTCQLQRANNLVYAPACRRRSSATSSTFVPCPWRASSRTSY